MMYDERVFLVGRREVRKLRVTLLFLDKIQVIRVPLFADSIFSQTPLLRNWIALISNS